MFWHCQSHPPLFFTPPFYGPRQVVSSLTKTWFRAKDCWDHKWYRMSFMGLHIEPKWRDIQISYPLLYHPVPKWLVHPNITVSY